MSATFYSDLRNGAVVREALDDGKMEQIRELLYGEFKRDNDARMALIEARVRELEAGIHRKLDAIQSRIETLTGDLKTDRTQAFDELSSSVLDLAERIRRISRA